MLFAIDCFLGHDGLGSEVEIGQGQFRYTLNGCNRTVGLIDMGRTVYIDQNLLAGMTCHVDGVSVYCIVLWIHKSYVIDTT